MSEDILVSSVEEYRNVCISLSRGNRVYVRGQTSDYPKILPSLFRPGAIVDESFENLIVRLYASCYGIGDWRELKDNRGDDFEDRQAAGVFPNLFPGGFSPGLPSFLFEKPFKQSWFNYDVDQHLQILEDAIKSHWTNHSDALLQHYGVPSRALDVTDDPLIALWFATNAFKRNPNGTAVFNPTETGDRVVYIFKDPQSELLDLQVIASAKQFGFEGQQEVPYYGLRGVVQKGLLLLGATKDNPDLRKQVSVVIHLEPGGWSQDILKAEKYTYREIMPPPDVDPFYAALLKERDIGNSEFQPVVQHIIEYV